MQRKENPAGVIPVLLMNPDERKKKMAHRKTTRRKPTTRRRRAPVRAANPHRRRRRRAAPRTTRRRRTSSRRRRRNPKFDIMGAVMAAVGGATMGGAAYALDGQDLTPNVKIGIMGIGAIALGLAVGGFNDKIGCGIAGGGAALAGKALMDQMLTKEASTEGMGRIPSYAYNKFGATPQNPAYRHLPGSMDAVVADLSSMDAIVADLDAVEAGLI